MTPEEFDAYRQQKDEYLMYHHHSPLPKEQREGFPGLPYFPFNPEMDMEIRAEEFEEKELFLMDTNVGEPRPFQRWGRLSFDIKGEAVSLVLYYSPHMNLYFLPFMDGTSGKETYAAGRYVDPEPVKGKKGVFAINFNMAYAPFCAYNPNYSCPIPPLENRIKTRIEAGEKNMGM